MGNVTMGLPSRLRQILLPLVRAGTFVETGTNMGATAAWAASQFDRVVTIEAYAPLFDDARDRLAAYPNVETLLGTSAEHLPAIVKSLTGPSIFWLDAHWSGEGTAGADNECPVLDEIDCIDTGAHEHILLIDDARFFLHPPPAPHAFEAWPSIGEVCACLNRRHPASYVGVIDDVVVRVPAAHRIAFCEALRTSKPAIPAKAKATASPVKRFKRWAKSHLSRPRD